MRKDLAQIWFDVRMIIGGWFIERGFSMLPESPEKFEMAEGLCRFYEVSLREIRNR
jgi:hypothetical protein